MTNAVFTLLYNPDYLAGALVLGSVLKKLVLRSDQKYPDLKFGILIDKSKFTSYQLQLLSRYYDDLIDVSPLKSTIVEKLTYDLKRPELDKTFTKVELWSLIQYEKILYLDSDTLPIIPDAANGGTVLDLLALDFPKFKILAAPDSGFPDIFNSGVFALRPNLDDYTNLAALVQESVINPNVSFDGADQGLLNQYFNAQPDWVQALLTKHDATVDLETVSYTQDSNWIKIPFLYNVTPSAEYQYLPALKHFQNPPGQPLLLENPQAEAELVDQGAEQPKHDKELWESTFDTIGRYHSTALLYINYKTTQVKVVHFIGKYKPWRLSSNVSGVHRDWWKAWIEEFGEKSLFDVVYGEKSLEKEPQTDYTPEPSRQEYPKEEPTEICEVKAEPAPEPPLDTSDPHVLLDPANYQRFEDRIQPSIDAMWDPTKEPPPKREDVKEEETHDFLEKVPKSFAKEWDSSTHYHHPPEEHEGVHDTQHHIEPYHQEEIQKNDQYNLEKDVQPPNNELHISPFEHQEHDHAPEHTPLNIPPERPELYGHKFVEPERVFDTADDYFPTHILQEVEKINISNKPDTEAEVEPTSASELATDVTAFNLMNDKLSKEGAIEESAFEEIYTEDNEEIDGEISEDDILEEEEEEVVPKLFPWEFRESGKVVAERVFD